MVNRICKDDVLKIERTFEWFPFKKKKKEKKTDQMLFETFVTFLMHLYELRISIR